MRTVKNIKNKIIYVVSIIVILFAILFISKVFLSYNNSLHSQILQREIIKIYKISDYYNGNLGFRDLDIFFKLSKLEYDKYIYNIDNTIYMLLISFIVFMLCVVSVVGGYILYINININKLIKSRNMELELNYQTFRIIQYRTNSIIFIVDIKKNKITIYYNDQKRKELYSKIDIFNPNNMLKDNRIKSKDYSKYKLLYENITNGKQYIPVEIEMKFNGRWEWRRISTWLSNKESIIGLVEDFSELNEQKEKFNIINEKAQHDFLTGLYNREFFIQQVDNYVQQSIDKHYALFIIDLDNFKKVNDILGHITGDTTLKEVGETLKSNIEKNHLLGRLGGDEFVLFIKDIADVDYIHKHAQKLNKQLLKHCEKNEKSVDISVSIGIAIAKTKMTFKELYEKADNALYQVKNNNRNGYEIYYSDV